MTSLDVKVTCSLCDEFGYALPEHADALHRRHMLAVHRVELAAADEHTAMWNDEIATPDIARDAAEEKR